MNISADRMPEVPLASETANTNQAERKRPGSFKRATAKTLIAMSSVLPLTNSSPAIDAHKPEGSYTYSTAGWDELDTEVHNEPIPAEPSEALTFSNNFDHLLSSRGYTVYIDEPAVKSMLRPNQIAVFEQIEGESDEDLLEQRTIIQPEAPSDEDNGVMRNYPVYNDGTQIYAESSAFGLSPSTDFDQNSTEGWVPLGNGLSAHTTTEQHPALITFSIYGPDENNELTPIHQQSTETWPNPNVSCEQGEMPIVSEVSLTASQLGVLCEALQQYDTLVPSDYQTLLDSVTKPLDQNNSVGNTSKSIILTFPFVGNEQVPADELRRIILHEFLHTTYQEVEVGSDEFHQFNDAYEDIVKVMEYKMPTDSQQYMSDVAVSDIEPTWAVITESSYQHEGSMIGHPWDNPTEMLSSTGAVLAFYPRQFIERFHTLTPSEQAAIRKAVEAVEVLTDTMGTPVTQFIPEYDRVQSAIAES